MIPMNDFRLQAAGIRDELFAAFGRVLDAGWYILGKEVEAFEREFADWLGVAEVVSVANGMDALQLVLMAHDIGPGAEVVTTPNSAFATTLAILRVGATPVFVDLDPDTYALDVRRVGSVLTERTRAILPVHIYGQAADLEPLAQLATRHGLVLLGDAAQAHGATYRGRDVATYGDAVAYSFYPTKNLGALGDGGAVACRDPERARRLRRLRDYGQGRRFQHLEAGLNSRLDELQAAFLRAKLPQLRRHNQRRRALAALYQQRLRDLPLLLPVEKEYGESVWHLFVVRTPRRDRLAGFLRDRGIHTLVHYPTLIPFQPALAPRGFTPGMFPVAERCAQEFLSLPLYPEMTDEQVEEVCAGVHAFFEAEA